MTKSMVLKAIAGIDWPSAKTRHEEQLGHSVVRLPFTTHGNWLKGSEKVRQPKLRDDWPARANA
jgi:hypothetical protein